ncbi:MAG TPA: DUF3352 domain-containing protein [Candidatus Limnocylindrales bacterium]|nr:DUF3352 domain-containing protein [Candidatus Limnocylindrales bacterium]
MTERDSNQPTGDPPRPSPSSDAPTPSPDDTAAVKWWAPAGQTPVPGAPVGGTPPSPTIAVPVRTSRGGRLRWGIALLITIVVIGLGAAAFVLLTGQTAPSSLVGYAPADSLIYGELRLDLPGDQRQKLGQFLSKFPGFKDQANLETKYDEVLDRVVLALTSNRQDFTNNIKPWFGGELGFGIGDLPTPTGATPDMSHVRMLALISVTDAAKARAWLDGILGDVTKTPVDHNGTQLVLVGDGSSRVATGIHGKVMLIGDETSVRAAIDTNGAGELAKSERYAAALGAIRGDSLGYFYVDFERYVEWLAAAAESAPDDFLGFQFDETYRKLLPEWGVARLQARGDSIAMEFVSPLVESALKLANRAGELAPHLPPTTIVLVDGHDMGESLLQTIEMYRTNPGTAEGFKQVDQVAVLLGGFDRILGWIRDGGLALTRDGDKVDGGLVFSPKDRASGERLLATLRSYAVIGGGQAGLQVEVRDEPYAGTTISIIDFGDWRDLAALGGGGALPFEGGRLEVAYAATDDVIVIGLGDSFVKAVLDAKPGASLADDARYKSLIDRVGAQNVGSVYLDITAVREMTESLMRSGNPGGFADYEREIQPYLLPLDAYIQSSVLDGGMSRSVGLVVVK